MAVPTPTTKVRPLKVTIGWWLEAGKPAVITGMWGY